MYYVEERRYYTRYCKKEANWPYKIEFRPMVNKSLIRFEEEERDLLFNSLLRIRRFFSRALELRGAVA
jgi:hypothetical protein